MTKKKDPDLISIFFEQGIDIEGRTIWMGSHGADDDGDEHGVNFLMAQKVVKGLYLLERLAPNGDKPIRLILNTVGGDEYDGYAIMDAIRNCKNHVTVIALGKAWSMGAYLLQCGDTRVVAPNCVCMFHSGTGNTTEGHPEMKLRWAKFENDVLKPRLDEILLERIYEKHPEFKGDVKFDLNFKDMNNFDAIMLPEKLIWWGLADRLLRPGELYEFNHDD